MTGRQATLTTPSRPFKLPHACSAVVPNANRVCGTEALLLHDDWTKDPEEEEDSWKKKRSTDWEEDSWEEEKKKY